MTAPLSAAFNLLGLALVLGTGLAFADRMLLKDQDTASTARSEEARAGSTSMPPVYAQTRARPPGLTSVLTGSSAAFDMPVFDLTSLSPNYRPSYGQQQPARKNGREAIPTRWLKFLPLPRRKPRYNAVQPPAYDWANAQFSSQTLAQNADQTRVKTPPPLTTAAAYNQAGYDALSGGDMTSALRFFNLSLDIDPNQPLIRSQKGYIYKRQGRYKVAGRAFGIAGTPGETALPGQRDLERERSYLGRPLRLATYSVWRQDSSPEGEISFGPSLAQSQSGLSAGYRLPIDGWASKHEVSAYTRLLWAYEPASLRVNSQSYQAGIGVQMRPFSSINLVTAAERLVSLGDQARDDWLLRASYSTGAGYAPLQGERSWLHWSLYGDVAIIDPADPDLQVAGDARIGIGKRPFKGSSFSVIPFAGLSANFQDAAGITTSLYETSAGLWMRYWPGGPSLPDPQRAFDVRMEYRAKVGGDSASASGLLLTVGLTY